MAPAAAASITICDGELTSEQITGMHEISTLILRGRQSSSLSHEAAVLMRESMRHSTLIEPENTGEFPAKDNPDAAAGAVNWFLSGSGSDGGEFSGTEPIDPKSSSLLATGQTVYYCCKGCDKKFLANPAKYAPKLAAQGVTINVEKLTKAGGKGHDGHDHDHDNDHDHDHDH